jgi:hypothetical protein
MKQFTVIGDLIFEGTIDDVPVQELVDEIKKLSPEEIAEMLLKQADQLQTLDNLNTMHHNEMMKCKTSNGGVTINKF